MKDNYIIKKISIITFNAVPTFPLTSATNVQIETATGDWLPDLCSMKLLA